MEGYTHTQFIYNLSKKSVKKIKLKKGRGPHEFLHISDIAISNNNIIFLVDDYSLKFIRLKPSGVFLKDRLAGVGRRPEKICIGNGYITFSDLNSQQSLFYERENHTFVPLKINHYSERKTHNLFKTMGHSIIQGNNLIQVRTYLPYLYVYNLKKKQLAKKIKFDVNDIDWGKAHHSSSGVTMMTAPVRVDFMSQDIARVPGDPHCVFLLIKGASKNRTYGKDKLFEYNYKKEKFVHTFKLPFKVREITVNDHYLFAYSHEKNKIYRWKIIHSK